MSGIRAGVIFASFAALLSAGCIKSHYTLYLLPDGSGKLSGNVRYGEFVSRTIASAAEQYPTMVLAAKGVHFDNVDDARRCGVVAWAPDDSVPPAEGFAGTVYFEDINRLKLCMPGDDACTTPFLRFRYTHEGSMNELVVFDSTVVGVGEMVAHAKHDAASTQEVREILRGFEVTYDITVPGAITSVQGFDKSDGRSAEIMIDEWTAVSAMRSKDASATVPKRLSIQWAAPELSKEEIAAFRKELEDARARYTAKKE